MEPDHPMIKALTAVRNLPRSLTVATAAADCAAANLRKTDALARLGGDEFAVLMPETGCGPGRSAIAKLAEELKLLMAHNGWPVTGSSRRSSSGGLNP